MNSFPPNTTVHLEAGDYQTKGYAIGVSGGWKPKRGFRIIGAGVDTTTLKLVSAATDDKQYFAIGGEDTTLADGFEISSLTVDANLGGQTSAKVATGGIKVFGTHVRISDLRVINFGTRTKAVVH